MTFRLVAMLVLLTLAWSPSLKAEWLYHGNCESTVDPETTTMSIISACVKAGAGSWLVQKSKTENDIQPDALHRADGSLGVFLTPWVSFHTEGHVNVYVSRATQLTSNREAQRDSWIVQVGNNALSRHRVHFGQGRPVYRIDHQQRKETEYAWSLRSFEAPVVNFASYVYDNQLDWTVQLSYGALPDINLKPNERLFTAARFMHDISALEGTRIAVGGWGDGLLRRMFSLGLLNVNGKGDATSIEVTRSFSRRPYDPEEFKQNIRASYLSHEQQNTRIKFQYDDFFREIRIAGLGAVYVIHENADIELQFGYAKHEDTPSKSHWFMTAHTGVHL